jgi:hypothetical protein
LERFVQFRCGDLVLEGKLHLPPLADRCPMVVVLHPHPRYGGTMDNYVVVRICEALADAGIGALRFNFRGAGRSDGHYGRSVDEEMDVHAAVAFAQSVVEADPQRVGLVGYSFGAKVALAAGQRNPNVRAIVAVSPADFVLDDRIFVKGSRVPKLLVVGRDDHLISVARLAELAERIDGPTNLDIYDNTDHFWADEDRVLARAVADFFVREFGAVPA